MLNTYRWQQLRATLITAAADRHDPCAICGQPIDYTAPGTTPQGATIDHTTPRALGGDPWDPTGLRVTHHRCNTLRGARLGNQRSRRRHQPAPTPTPSRNW